MEPSPKKVQQKDERGREGKWDLCGRGNAEKESLIEELVEKEDTITRKGWISIETATQGQRDCRRYRSGKKRWRALKRPRNADEGGASLKRCKSSRAEPLVDFLREKAEADREIKQQELRAKQQEQECQQQMMKAMILQQQQMNTAFLNVVEKLPKN